MENFSDIYTDVLDSVNRPASEMLARAKREINNALYWLQRKHMFKMSERLFRVTYPANTLTFDLTQVCEGTIRDYMNATLLSGPTQITGVPIKIKSYDAVLRQREKFQGAHEYHDDLTQVSVPDFDSHSEFVRNTNRYDLFLSGQNKIGLYPTPQAEVYLMFNCHVWLPKLVLANDTNFLLVYGYDVVLNRAVTTMSHYLKEDRRKPVNDELFQESLRTLFEWDSTIRPTPSDQ